MAVVVMMPDGTEKEFPDISSAKAYKRALLADPNVGGALKMTGDPDQAKMFLELQGKGQDLKKGELETMKLQREVEGPSPLATLETGMGMMQEKLSAMPVGQRGPWAISKGLYRKARGALGYEPERSFNSFRESLALPYRRYLEGSTRLSDQDIKAAVRQMPELTDPEETRAAKIEAMRRMVGLPVQQRSNAWNAMRRHAIQAPQGGEIR